MMWCTNYDQPICTYIFINKSFCLWVQAYLIIIELLLHLCLIGSIQLFKFLHTILNGGVILFWTFYYVHHMQVWRCCEGAVILDKRKEGRIVCSIQVKKEVLHATKVRAGHVVGGKFRKHWGKFWYYDLVENTCWKISF